MKKFLSTLSNIFLLKEFPKGIYIFLSLIATLFSLFWYEISHPTLLIKYEETVKNSFNDIEKFKLLIDAEGGDGEKIALCDEFEEIPEDGVLDIYFHKYILENISVESNIIKDISFTITSTDAANPVLIPFFKKTSENENFSNSPILSNYYLNTESYRKCASVDTINISNLPKKYKIKINVISKTNFEPLIRDNLNTNQYTIVSKVTFIRKILKVILTNKVLVLVFVFILFIIYLYSYASRKPD